MSQYHITVYLDRECNHQARQITGWLGDQISDANPVIFNQRKAIGISRQSIKYWIKRFIKVFDSRIKLHIEDNLPHWLAAIPSGPLSQLEQTSTLRFPKAPIGEQG